jgi:splicing factor 3B subunit 4
VGATLFIGSLDPLVDEKLLHDTFSAFGALVSPAKIARDPDTGASRGFGFVSYDNFEASDAALQAMHGQFLMNQTINVDYAFKRDGKGERHGSEAERTLAAQFRKVGPAQVAPHRMFAESVLPGSAPPPHYIPPPPMMMGAPPQPHHPMMAGGGMPPPHMMMMPPPHSQYPPPPQPMYGGPRPPGYPPHPQQRPY